MPLATLLGPPARQGRGTGWRRSTTDAQARTARRSRRASPGHPRSLSDATRRGVLEQLAHKDASISELAARFRMTLTGMKKHVGAELETVVAETVTRRENDPEKDAPKGGKAREKLARARGESFRESLIPEGGKLVRNSGARGPYVVGTDTWIATATNPQFSLEIARRCVRIRLDPKTDRPRMRATFKHSPIRDWAKESRASLVRALLVLVRAWLVAGRAPGRRVLGAFERWAATVGGILEHAGLRGFLEDTEKLYEAADREGSEWRAFLTTWHARFGSEVVGAQELLAIALDRELLTEVIGDKSMLSRAQRLGRALHSIRDRKFGQFRVELASRAHHVSRWRVVVVPPTDSAS